MSTDGLAGACGAAPGGTPCGMNIVFCCSVAGSFGLNAIVAFMIPLSPLAPSVFRLKIVVRGAAYMSGVTCARANASWIGPMRRSDCGSTSTCMCRASRRPLSMVPLVEPRST